MNIVLIEDKKQWNDWLVAHSQFSPFPQSREWGDILVAEGKRIEYLAVIDGEKIIAAVRVTYMTVPGGWNYAFAPKGPVIFEREEEREKREEIYQTLLRYLETKKCIFFRIEPVASSQTVSVLVKRVIDLNPQTTLLIDLSKSADALLSDMHPKTRYNIRLAQKKSLAVSNKKDFSLFWKLLQTTGERDQFRLHERGHYEQVLASSFSHQITITNEGQPVVSAVFIGFGSTFTYLYGASEYTKRHLMGPYLMQWEAMQLGKNFGYHYYDFFGIAPAIKGQGERTKENREDVSEYQYDLKHRYAGFTRFKLGFGGFVHEDPGTFDLIISSWKYRMYQILRRTRRLF